MSWSSKHGPRPRCDKLGLVKLHNRLSKPLKRLDSDKWRELKQRQALDCKAQVCDNRRLGKRLNWGFLEHNKQLRLSGPQRHLAYRPRALGHRPHSSRAKWVLQPPVKTSRHNVRRRS